MQGAVKSENLQAEKMSMLFLPTTFADLRKSSQGIRKSLR